MGISQRGDPHFRKLLVHRARCFAGHVTDKDDVLNQWAKNLAARKLVNVITVALANKTARVAWAVVRNDTAYQPSLVAGEAHLAP